MPSKSCEHDTIPTTLLEKVLKHHLPSIAEIVNLLLDTWKILSKMEIHSGVATY